MAAFPIHAELSLRSRLRHGARVPGQCLPASRTNLSDATWCFSAFLRSPDGAGAQCRTLWPNHIHGRAILVWLTASLHLVNRFGSAAPSAHLGQISVFFIIIPLNSMSVLFLQLCKRDKIVFTLSFDPYFIQFVRLHSFLSSPEKFRSKFPKVEKFVRVDHFRLKASFQLMKQSESQWALTQVAELPVENWRFRVH